MERLWINNNQLSGCYDASLLNLCTRLDPTYNTNSYISDGNNFDAPWQDFCNTGTGTCESVYPGDFNYNGIANEADMLHWGLGHGNIGLPRPVIATDWNAQAAELWTDIVDGINGMHQDGNGDGVVDNDDTDVLLQNFGLVHNSSSSASVASTLVYDLVRRDTTSGLYYDLYVKDGADSSIYAHGISLVLNFGDIPIDEIGLDTTGSSLQPDVTFELYDAPQNKFHIALTRTNGIDQFCDGPVAGLVVIAQDIATGDPLEIMRLENGTSIQADSTIQNITDASMYDTYPGFGAATDNISVSVSAQHTQCGVPGSATVSALGGIPPYTYVWNTGESDSIVTNLTAEVYEVTVTDSDDNTATISIEIEGQYLPGYDDNGNLIDCTVSPCSTLLTPDGTIDAGTYQAGTTVNSDGTVNGNVQFKAGATIILKAGFTIPPGTEFSGTIEDCPDN